MAKITIGDLVIEGSIEELKQMGVKIPLAEAETEPLKVGDYAKVVATDTTFAEENDIFVITHVNYVGSTMTYPYQGKRVGDGRREQFFESEITRATAEEVAEKELEIKWAKIGRKPNEFKVGDIVRVEKPCGAPLKQGELVEVIYKSSTKGSVIVAVGWAVSVSELITPVEARFDL